MARRLAPAAVIAEEACEAQSLVWELRRSMARIWAAAQATARPELLAEASDLAPDLAEVEWHAKRIAALAERFA